MNNFKDKKQNEFKAECPKCKSRFGVAKIINSAQNRTELICKNGDCDWMKTIYDKKLNK